MIGHDELADSVAQVRTRLLSEFVEALSTDAIDAALATHQAQFASARVVTFAPMLIERACRDQLRRHLVVA